MTGKELTSIPNWRAAAGSTLLIVAMAVLAFGIRWDPKLEFTLERVSFYLETPAEMADGTFEPPIINCAVRATVTNAGRAVLVVAHMPTDWDPPIADGFDGRMCAIPQTSPPGARNSTMGFRHVPENAARVRFRFPVTAYRPSRWKDWLGSHLTIPAPLWLDTFLSNRESRTIYSPWFEAKVPPVEELRAPTPP